MKEEKKYTTGFKTPGHYFDDLEERLLNTIKGDAIPKETGFNVPDGYFDQLEETILKRLPTSSKKASVEVIPLYQRRGFMIAASIAACVAFIVNVVNFSSETPLTLNDINTETIASYINDGNLDLSAQEIALLLQEEDMNALAVPSEDISNENLTDYLLNNIDNPTLYIE